MRRLIIKHALCAAALLLTSCSQPASAPPPSNQQTAASRATPAPPSVASSHGDNTAAAAPASNSNANAPAAPPSNSSANSGSQAERQLVNTTALDDKIKKALVKAKSPNASAADKREAAGAYLERGNVYFSAGSPRVYKYALADFNSVLLYDPANADAKAKRDEILRIYKDMGRPVPQVSNEQ